MGSVCTRGGAGQKIFIFHWEKPVDNAWGEKGGGEQKQKPVLDTSDKYKNSPIRGKCGWL